jgi:hypothetical protein
MSPEIVSTLNQAVREAINTPAGLVPGIHVVPLESTEVSRGWPGIRALLCPRPALAGRGQRKYSSKV